MIRTKVVDLTVIKAIAYRQKLTSGGSGIVIMREDTEQPGIASISTKTGEPIPTANTPKALYPQEAFMEAMELTAGLPYKKLGKVQMTSQNIVEEPIQEEPAPEEEPVSEIEIVVDSADYEKIVEYYTDKNGKLSYDLLNKDMIQYAHSSNAVSKMIENDESIDDIRLYVVGSRFRKITENPDLTDEQVIVIVELLDEVSPKGVFKEFDAELRRMKANKNK